MSNKIFFRKHRKYQLLKWIEAFDQDIPDLSEYHPTASNLAYFLITETDYRQAKLEEEFQRREVRRPSKEVFQYVKRDLTRRFEQYNPNLFEKTTVSKTERNHKTLEKGLEDRKVSTTAYYLSETGENKLDWLSDRIAAKQNLVETQKTNYQLSDGLNKTKIITVLKNTYVDYFEYSKGEKIPIDKIEIPDLDSYFLSTDVKKVPRIAITDSESDTPTIDRSHL